MEAYEAYVGTPPRLYPKPKERYLLRKEKAAYETRIRRLCKQVDKLSWMLAFMELMCDGRDIPPTTLEEAEREWERYQK